MAGSSPKHSQGRKQLSERRVLIICVAVLFLGAAVVLWIVNAGSWSNILSIIFTFTGVLVGLFQWLFPVSTSSEGRPQNVPAQHALVLQPTGGAGSSPALPPIVLHLPLTTPTPVDSSATDAVEKVVYRGILGLPPPTDPRTIQQRETAVHDIYALLLQPATSTVVLTGIGGVGKSTLAALVYSHAEAQRQSAQGPFTDPAIWLNIDPSVTMADLAGNLCEIFGKPLPDFSNLSLQHQALALFNILNAPDASRLLVLDQFENLLDWQTGHALADRPGVGEWLDALNSRPCRSRILMTTRPWPLGTREYPPTCMHEYVVKGMELAEGVEFLHARGIEGDEQALRKVVERCGGHAFALNLLASLLRHRKLTLAAFFNDSSYAHVWTGNVARNLLDDIYTSQLNETQRKLLLAFSVYREPVSLSAARALCDFAESVSLAQIQAALDALLAQHLLQAVGDGSYQLHAIIESYARDNFVARDEQANEQALRAAHARAAHYYIDLAARASAQQMWGKQLSDYDPLTEAAWQLCQARRWQEAYKLIEGEKLFANLKDLGGLPIVLELYKLLLPLKKWQPSPPDGARVYNRLGNIYRSLGRREQALQYLEQASALCKESGEEKEAIWTLNHLGRLYASMGEKERARLFYEDALTRARAIDEPLLEGVALNNLGRLYSAWGQKEQEQKSYTEALAIYRELGDPRGEAVTLNNLGRVSEDLGDSEQAQKYYIAGLDLFRQVQGQRDQGWSLNNLGRSCLLAGEPERARAYLEEALRIRRKVDRKGEGRTLNNLGAVHASNGDYQLAWACYREALAITTEITDQEGRGKILRNLGAYYLAQKRYSEALACLLCARAILDEIQTPGRENLQTYLDALHQEIGDDAFLALLSQVEPRAETLVEHALQAQG